MLAYLVCWSKQLPRETLNEACDNGTVPDMASFLWEKSSDGKTWTESMFVLRGDGIVVGDLESPEVSDGVGRYLWVPSCLARLSFTFQNMLCNNDHWTLSYRVGSANFSQRKIGHAHDNSADSENVAGAPPTECARTFHFSFRKRSGKSELFFYPQPKYSWNESTTSSADGQLTRHGQGVSARPPAALRKIWFSTA